LERGLEVSCPSMCQSESGEDPSYRREREGGSERGRKGEREEERGKEGEERRGERATVMPQLSGGDDLGASDEMIAFKDEGDQEEKNPGSVSAERDLADVKSSLVNETEEPESRSGSPECEVRWVGWGSLSFPCPLSFPYPPVLFSLLPTPSFPLSQLFLSLSLQADGRPQPRIRESFVDKPRDFLHEGEDSSLTQSDKLPLCCIENCATFPKFDQLFLLPLLSLSLSFPAMFPNSQSKGKMEVSSREQLTPSS